MAAYNFQERFVARILDGSKQHTIRATRKRKTKVGETVHLFTGMRTKNCKLLMRAICTKVESIEIIRAGPVVKLAIYIDGRCLDRTERDQFAKADGFANLEEMLIYWSRDNGLPFKGEIIHWNTSEALEFQRLVPGARNVRFVDPRSATR